MEDTLRANTPLRSLSQKSTFSSSILSFTYRSEPILQKRRDKTFFPNERGENFRKGRVKLSLMKRGDLSNVGRNKNVDIHMWEGHRR